MTSKGVTLIELVIVISIIGILAIALGFSYVGWQGRYKVEKTTKDIYSDLMAARARAMQRNRNYFADFNFPVPVAGFGTYRIAEDTNEDGEGDTDADGVIDAAGHTILPTFPKTVDHPITWNGGGIITFDRRGIVSPNGTIQVTSTADPDYDCIIVFSTRINMGKWNGATCDAK